MKNNDSACEAKKEEYFGNSRLWDMQRNYYQSKSISAWSEGKVPYYVTSSATAGKAYAQMASALLSDIAHTAANASKSCGTTYILELGAGHGRFTYFFLKYFLPLWERTGAPNTDFCYIMSDFVKNNIEFWEKNEKFRPYVEKGILDFCLFDIQKRNEIQLRNSGIRITPKSLNKPLIVIANYVFDCIPQELFHIRDHRLRECKIAIDADFEANCNKAFNPEELKAEYNYYDIEEIPYKEDYLAEIMRRYINETDDSHILFPVTALRCLEYLRGLSTEGIALLTADKGTHLHYNEGVPYIVPHDGSFSLSVNYNALKMYCENLGGMALFPEYGFSSINIGCLLITESPGNYKKITGAYENFAGGIGPDILYRAIESITKESGEILFSDIMCVAVMSEYDSFVFITRVLPALYYIMPQITETERLDIYQMIPKVWGAHYPLDDSSDLAYELGTLMYMLGFYKEAIYYFGQSSKANEKQTIQNTLNCYYALNDYENAIAMIKKACG